jgi:hypothetical protein
MSILWTGADTRQAGTIAKQLDEVIERVFVDEVGEWPAPPEVRRFLQFHSRTDRRRD